jgi:hypothetical protein
MGRTTRRLVAILGLLGVALAGGPTAARAQGPKGKPQQPAQGHVLLYELTENMKLMQRGKQRAARRVATSALTGVAELGTPFCPVPEFQSGPAGCALNVLASDDIDLGTGLGTFEGEAATVIQGDNPFDGPEAVVLKTRFKGQMDFSPAILHQIPFGRVVGTVRGERGLRSDFSGVFRLPFAGNIETEVEVAPGMTVTLTLRQLFCPATPLANPNAPLYGGFDLAYLDNVEEATTPLGRCLDILPTQLTLGVPAVQFKVGF